MNKQKSKEGYNGIFLERAGVDYKNLTEELLSPPEFPLSEIEKTEVYAFDNFLSENILTSGKSIIEAIATHAEETVIAPMFFGEAIKNMNAEELGEDISFDSLDDVYKWLSECIKDGTKQPKELLQIAKNSVKRYKETMSDCLQNGTDPSLDSISHMSLIADPARLYSQATDISEARKILKDLRRNYHEGGDPVDGAKRSIIDIYLAKVNGLASMDIVFANYLIDQSKLIDDEEMIDLAKISVPSNLLDYVNNPATKDLTIKRLDYIRNGIGIDQNGNSSAVSCEVTSEVNDIEEGFYSDEQAEKLKCKMLSPQDMSVIISNSIDKADLLSRESSETWNPNRGKRAYGEKYQVVVNPGSGNFAVDGVDGVFKIASEQRSLYDLIAVGSHELTHVAQCQADLKMGENFAFAKLKGKRVSMIREAGANAMQREVEKKLFGASKPIAVTYANALKELESGGDLGDVAKAFYNEKLKAFPSIDHKKAANEAADRVLRLVRGGGINSTSMAYAEESILNKEMQNASSEIKNRATLITCLDLVDQVRLHKYGLLPEVESNPEKLVELFLNEIAPCIDETLSSNSV